MASTANGSFESIVIANRRFSCDAEDEPNIVLPGFTNEVKPNSDGSVRVTKKRHAGKIDGVKIQIDVDLGDLQFIQESADKAELLSISATMTNGKIVDGEAQITGDLQYNAADGTMEISLEGTFRIM